MDKIYDYKGNVIDVGGGGGGGEAAPAIWALPCESDFPINAEEYHALWDNLLDSKYLTRSEVSYMSDDSNHKYPLCYYRLSINQDYLGTNYRPVGNTGDNPCWIRPKIFIQSGLHGNERCMPTMVYEFFKRHLSDNQGMSMLAPFDWYIYPLANPRGYSQTCIDENGNPVVDNTHYTGTTLDSPYTIVENDYSRNFGLRRNGKGIDPNRDFDDTSGFKTEEAQYARDLFISVSPLIAIDLHQDWNDSAGGTCGFLSSTFKNGTSEDVVKSVYAMVTELAKVDIDVCEYYNLPYKQISHIWASSSNAYTAKNYYSGQSYNGGGNINHQASAAIISQTLESDTYCKLIGGKKGVANAHNSKARLVANSYANAMMLGMADIAKRLAFI